MRASLPQKPQRVSDPSGSSTIGASDRSPAAAPAASLLAWATHRSQMYTPGPAISLAHSSRQRPQNEHGPAGSSSRPPAIWWTRWWLSRSASAISRSDPPAACRRRMAWW